MVGLGGNDILNGDLGNDTMCGGPGEDRLQGNAGNDDIFGEGNNDMLFGGSGVDDMYGGSGNDDMNGQSEVDYMYGGTGNDTLIGGTGRDRMYGEGGFDNLNGSGGSDFMYGGDQVDTMRGATGNDYMEMNAGGNLGTIYVRGQSPNTQRSPPRAGQSHRGSQNLRCGWPSPWRRLVRLLALDQLGLVARFAVDGDPFDGSGFGPEVVGHAVLRSAVVPHGERVFLPAEPALHAGVHDGPLEVVEDLAAFSGRDPFDVGNERGIGVNDLLARLGVHSNHRVTPQRIVGAFGFDLFRGPPSTERQQSVVHRGKPSDAFLPLQRPDRRLLRPRDVAMPLHRSDGPVGRGIDLEQLRETGHLAVLLEVQFAHLATKGDVLLAGDVLVSKEQHLVLQPGGANRSHLRVVHTAEVHTPNLGSNGRLFEVAQLAEFGWYRPSKLVALQAHVREVRELSQLARDRTRELVGVQPQVGQLANLGGQGPHIELRHEGAQPGELADSATELLHWCLAVRIGDGERRHVATFAADPVPIAGVVEGEPTVPLTTRGPKRHQRFALGSGQRCVGRRGTLAGRGDWRRRNRWGRCSGRAGCGGSGGCGSRHRCWRWWRRCRVQLVGNLAACHRCIGLRPGLDGAPGHESRAGHQFQLDHTIGMQPLPGNTAFRPNNQIGRGG
ncbi:Exotoxin PaxA [Nymphon striatum]|nr:Exotoxin PaxA [Nymphon striatum]